MKEFPVVYQDFENEEAEYAFLQADNAIALWAELDFSGINSDIADLGPDFDIDMLGIKNFTIDVSEKVNRGDENSEWVDMPEFKEGDKYIKLTFIFADEEKRLQYCKDNNISIERKMNNQWIVYG